MTSALLAGSAVLGLLVGSFLNVVAARVPHGRSIVRPPSQCPSCHAAILRRDNIPIASWLILGRRCRRCRAPIAARYPLVEGLTAVVFAMVAARFGLAWALPSYLVLSATLVVVSATDIEMGVVPTRIVAPVTAVTAVLLTLAAGLDDRWSALGWAAAGAATTWLGVVILSKLHLVPANSRYLVLAPLLGAHLGYLGPLPVVVGLIIASLVIATVPALRASHRSANGPLPMAPLLAATTLAVVLFGASLTSGMP